jgi:hypothetical protein
MNPDVPGRKIPLAVAFATFTLGNALIEQHPEENP